MERTTKERGDKVTSTRNSAVKKTAEKTAAAKKAAVKKAAVKKAATKPTGVAKAATAAPRLLTGGNPQIAKADGAAPVQAYIDAMPGWKRDIGRRLDALIMTAVPTAQRAVKWNSPFYGIKGKGWFVSFHTFTNFVKVTFFLGASLTPVPPGGEGKDARWINVHEDDLDEARMVKWMKQAAALPGWGKS
jgi:hypothetical protein